MRLMLTINLLQTSLRSCVIKKNNQNIFGMINIFTLLKLQNGELIKKKKTLIHLQSYVTSKSMVLYQQKNWFLVLQSNSFTIKTFFVVFSFDQILNLNINTLFVSIEHQLQQVWSENIVRPSFQQERSLFRGQILEVWSDEREILLLLCTSSQAVVGKNEAASLITQPFQRSQRSRQLSITGHFSH